MNTFDSTMQARAATTADILRLKNEIDAFKNRTYILFILIICINLANSPWLSKIIHLLK